ncbi:MAG: hypothetical protein FD123_2561 [Bacteroidetes bacterium]|nr:MAG: hypothetical protein FD123_2561 [Bacteroidota bacterium]
MAESITISPNDPPLKSMDYALLRELGLQHIQGLSGKIWSDNNAHDPGITILEVLAYAVTDLGYRTNYDIKDILTPDPLTTDIRNFFTAAQIMPNAPVTFNDYRKLMMDVECEELIDLDPDDLLLRYGVRNAWILKTEAECPVFVNSQTASLQYTAPVPDAEPLALKPLYNVLIELDTLDEEFGGDLNENTIEGQIVLSGVPQTGSPASDNTPFLGLEGVVIDYVIEFPRWDTPGIEWYACDPTDGGIPGNIKQNAVKISLSFSRLPGEYIVEDYGLLSGTKNFWISLDRRDASLSSPTPQQIADANLYVENQLNDVLYFSTSIKPSVVLYQEKVQRVLKVIAKVRETLMENRNLCEDFVKINAVKVEEIALCADIETSPDADIEEINAQIYFQVARFLDPTIYFYTLDEMFAKGKTTDEIFEGPLLQHGFIEESELVKADRRDVIHVSDLISIIMDIPGVTAVKSIQIANVPLDNDDNIVSKTVRWCLEIAVALNYVPRLSIELSRLTFFKDNLPFRAKQVDVKKRIDELEAAERPQKQHDIPLDLPVPLGEFKDIENYYSLQEEFPLLYGIGTPGLPASASSARKGQAKELKAYLLFFEQLLANYLSQLFHVKDLFSMDDSIDPVTGDPVINKTYFSQSLLNLVPDAAALYFETIPTENAEDLQAITEDPATFLQRRNRFLDHLAARFAENFNDYALLVYTLDSKKAPEELIEDKLAFLNNYPLISSARDKAMNYMDPCELWHVDNISGLERRASFLAGIDRPLEENLIFTSDFKYDVIVTGGYTFRIFDGTYYLFGVDAYLTKEESRLALERAIVNASQIERYVIRDKVGEIVYKNSCVNPTYRTYLLCNDENFAVLSSDPISGTPVEFPDYDSALLAAGDTVIVAKNELLFNVESNRYNFSCTFLNYTSNVVGPDIDMHEDPDPCPPDYKFTFDASCFLPDILMSGTVFGQALKTDDIIEVTEKANANFDRLLFEFYRQAKDAANYKFVYDTYPTEKAKLLDRCGNEIGTLTETNFGDAIFNDLSTLPLLPGIIIGDSTSNDGTYPIVSVVQHLVNPQWIDIEVSGTVNVPTKVDGFAEYTLNNTNIITLNQAEKTLDIDRDLSRVVFPGEIVTLNGFTGIGGNNDDFTVLKIESTGVSTSTVYLKQAIPDPISGTPMVRYTKRLAVVNVDSTNNIFTVAHAADLMVVQQAADCVRNRFFNHEGMHILEHILFRPCCNENVWQDVFKGSGNGLVKTSGSDGKLTLVMRYKGIKTNPPAKEIFIFGIDLTPFLTVNQPLKIDNSLTLATFQGTIQSFSYDPGLNQTTIVVHQPVTSALDGGDMLLQLTLSVLRVPNSETIILNIFSPGIPAVEFAAVYSSSAVGNDGSYRLDIIPGSRDSVEVIARLVNACDNFLPILLNDPCEDCNYTDPYSFIATVILPSWQGRFENQPFRRFFERTLRMECPAQVLLNICWVDCKEMEEFELKYKTWLLEHARKNRDLAAHSKALNELIEVLGRLRSDYPQGTLHDCEETEDFSNSIILNNSIIGTL